MKNFMCLFMFGILCLSTIYMVPEKNDKLGDMVTPEEQVSYSLAELEESVQNALAIIENENN